MGRVRLAVIFVAVVVALLAGTVGRAQSQTSSAALVLSAAIYVVCSLAPWTAALATLHMEYAAS